MNTPESTAKRWLLVFQRPPYGSALAREAVDVALAAAAFGQQVSLLFLGNSVWQLLPNQQGDAIGHKDFDRQLGALPMYDIDQFFVAADALTARGLAATDLVLPVTVLEPAAIAPLLASHDIVLSF
ncbi:MAG: sulfurtransferase complex subunit TusC [Spongiibacteraceae bacterium]|jgi:tRNA 2-thiouridine synthesizing protein C|nr:sulfurtransferase complex subunit TusC [Spongiibacteraceae bacterium]